VICVTQNSIDVRGDARPALTSLRFIGALLVFLTHAAFLSPFADAALAGNFADLTHNAGHLGVSFFFVLSGFVLTWAAGAGDSLRGFYRRRIVKIVPNHLVVFIGAVGVMTLIGASIGLFPYILNLFVAQAWVWDFQTAAQSPNSPTWSLGVEVFFYALFPLFYLLVRRIRHDRVWFWWAATGVAILAIPIIVVALTPSGPPSPAFEGGTWLQQKALLFFPVTRLPDFFIGMLTARLVQEKRFVKIGTGSAAALVAAVYVLGLFLPRVYAFAGLWAFPVALLIGAAATRDPSKPGLLESRPAIWAGEASYAFFLVHLPLLMLVLHLTGGAKMGVGAGILFLLGMTALCLVVSRLLFVVVERPAMRRWSRPKSTAPTSTPAAAEPSQPTSA
jgi:peptidoglycan/LPS O-acetylase OafA/YrhL